MTSPTAARGVVRLLNTAGGRVLCLAGDVDEAVVTAFLQRYGREPARVDRIEAGSVTSLSVPALDLVLDHLDAAELAGRPVACTPLPPLPGGDLLRDPHRDGGGDRDDPQHQQR